MHGLGWHRVVAIATYCRRFGLEFETSRKHRLLALVRKGIQNLNGSFAPANNLVWKRVYSNRQTQ